MERAIIEKNSPAHAAASSCAAAALTCGTARAALGKAVGEGDVVKAERAARSDIKQAHRGRAVGASDDDSVGAGRPGDGNLVGDNERGRAESGVTHGG